ncbi:hypothetical protein EDD36DRAFT_463195 [Exophiala viscosa]|uniref:Uncharacterized protein n=1 Tax=Exophiala viscosa TaxID=2486360 RepID=A0AAN6IFM6_9EURO|nr:hypothetical protein EDD36DRAFT_463195 [Exophiala viscosa]
MSVPSQCVSLAQLDLMSDWSSEETSPSTYSVASYSSLDVWRTSKCDSPNKSFYGASPRESEEDSDSMHAAAQVRSQPTRRRSLVYDNLTSRAARTPIRHVSTLSDCNVKKPKHKSMSHPASIDWFFSTFLSAATITDNERCLLEELVPESVVDALSVEAVAETRLAKSRSVSARSCEPPSTWLDPVFERKRRRRTSCKTWHFEADKHQTELDARFVDCSATADQRWEQPKVFRT